MWSKTRKEVSFIIKNVAPQHSIVSTSVIYKVTAGATAGIPSSILYKYLCTYTSNIKINIFCTLKVNTKVFENLFILQRVNNY